MLLIRYSLSLLFFSFIVLFSGCGGGGSSSVVITPTVTSNFVDDPVENLNFTCSSGTTGITDKSGKYSCCVGDSVIFTLGATTLGPIDTRAGMVTPYDVFPTNIRAAVNLATLLQSLDNNTTDSIISLDNNLLSMLGVIDFTLAPSDFKTAVEAMLNKSLIDDTLARTNMDASIRANGGTPPTLGNHIPVATTTSLDAIQDTNLTGFLAGIDIDGDSVITYIKVSDPSHGTLNINADGSFSYMPDASYNGLDSFSYKVNDGTVDSVAVSVTIHILDVANGTVPVNDSDNDYIPDDIENMLGMDPNNSDENGDGVLDGLQSSGIHGDKFFDKQWHIISNGATVNDSGIATTVGNDLDVKELYHKYMGYNGGNNIIVQVVDSGVDADHEDLAINMDMNRSLDGENKGDPSNVIGGDDPEHGTMVAGIIAARAFNEKGVRGIIPFAKIAGSNLMDDNRIGYVELEKAWLTGEGANEIAITNNSWGTYISNTTFFEEIMKEGVSNLRDKKGRVYVFSAGNERIDANGNLTYGNSNLQYKLSNRYAIVVAALKHDNTYAAYSSPGSNVLVSGYAGNFYQDSPTIGTTTIMGTSKNSGDINTKTTWSEDTNQNYTFAMNGTSAAAPVVSASIALVLEACPNLTWRDIKYLVAKNAKQVDISSNTWVQNNAGLWHSIDYGFGLINPKGMIDECSNNYTNLSAEKIQSVTKSFNVPISDDNTIQSFTIDMTDPSIKIEWVEVTVDNNSSYASDYKIELVSPSGTKTKLIDINLGSRKLIENWMDGGFRFATAAMIDEDSQGSWKVEITDTIDGDSGTLKSIKLEIYGH